MTKYKRVTKKNALALSEAKWILIEHGLAGTPVEDGRDSVGEPICALCEAYRYRHPDEDCEGCPLLESGEWCFNEASLYQRWYAAASPDKPAAARKLRALITKLREAEEN